MESSFPLQNETIPEDVPVRRGYGRIVVVGLVVALLGLLGWGLRARAGGPVENGVAPDFSLTTFEGQTVTLGELRGKVVIINFWASWCVPCRQEAAYLESTWRAYKDKGVVFVGVNYVDAEPNARAYLDEFDITYPSGPDPAQKIARTYRIKGVPETFYVDKAGQLRVVQIGPFSPPTLEEKINELLAEKSPATGSLGQ